MVETNALPPLNTPGEQKNDKRSPFQTRYQHFHLRAEEYLHLKQWLLTWVGWNPRGSVSQSQGLGGGQDTPPTHIRVPATFIL